MLTVRAAEQADYGVFVNLFPELQVADPVPTSEEFVGHMMPRVVIAQDGGTPVGYAWWRCFGRTAHLAHLVVAPEARRRGCARILLENVRDRVRAFGCTRWYLNVLQDNAVAIRAYERIGMTTEQQGWSLDTTWAVLDALPGKEMPAHEVRQVQSSDDPVIANQFGIDVERLDQLRNRPSTLLYACHADGRLSAFAAFDSSYPVVHPIHATRLDVLPILLRALRRHARHAHVHVTVDGNRPLYEALRATGGQLRHAFFRMGTPL